MSNRGYPLSYLYLFLLLFLLIASDCSHPTAPPPPAVPDTTSHNFAFTQYTFGGNAGSSSFSDAAIINDTLAYAVGAVYLIDSTTGQPDPLPYNLAKWNGNNWQLLRVTTPFRSSQVTLPLEGIFAYSSNDVWLIGSLPIHGNGSSWTLYDLRSMPGLDSISVSKGWGTSSSSMYFVGRSGSIVFYNGSTWTKLSSGTTVDLHDVWGTPDGSMVWACGYSYDNLHSVLLKATNSSWGILWQRDGTVAVDPFGFNVGSLWRGSSTFAASSNGVFRLDSDVAQTKISGPFLGFTASLRGNADNDFVVAGDDATIWHYNGASGKLLSGGNSSQPFYSCAIKGNCVIAVGTDYTIGFGAGSIILGRRQ